MSSNNPFDKVRRTVDAGPKAPRLQVTNPLHIIGSGADFAQAGRRIRHRREALRQAAEANWFYRFLNWLPLIFIVLYGGFFVLGFFFNFKKVFW